jgi:toluene monooxygenase system protein B
MSQIPLTWSVEGDYEVRFVSVDTEDTIDETAKAAAAFAVGRWVPEQPGKTLRVRIQGQTNLLPRNDKVKDHLNPWESIEVIFE